MLRARERIKGEVLHLKWGLSLEELNRGAVVPKLPAFVMSNIRLCARTSAAGSGSKRQVADADEDHQEHEPCHPHQARVGDVSRTLRFDAGDGQNAGDDYGETEPS